MRPLQILPGDTIGIFSPSWGGAGLLPDRTRQGLRQIERMDFRWKLAKHALGAKGYLSGTAEERASDLHELFADPEVKLILSAIGGDHACHLLPLLDADLIRANPKIVMGFSDMTVLNVAIHRLTELVTFNGPALLTDFAEGPTMFGYTHDWFRKLTCEVHPSLTYQPAETWTEEFLDWEQPENLQRARRMQPSPGWTWLKPGQAQGRLVGGCIESLQHLRGTRYWPDFDGALFFWETSEEKPLPETIDSLLMDYENMGVLAQLNGMLVGRSMKYSDAEKAQLRQVILQRTAAYDFPILTDMDFGHTSPQFPLPIGCLSEIDTPARCFRLLEPAIEPALKERS